VSEKFLDGGVERLPSYNKCPALNAKPKLIKKRVHL
jgi:hypothetical protein